MQGDACGRRYPRICRRGAAARSDAPSANVQHLIPHSKTVKSKTKRCVNMKGTCFASDLHTGQLLHSRSGCPRCTRAAFSSLTVSSRIGKDLQQVSSSFRNCRASVVRAVAQEQADAVADAPKAEDGKAKKRRTPGRQTYRPASFKELVTDATTSLRSAIDDGLTRLEVEFPSLPGNVDGEQSLVLPSTLHDEHCKLTILKISAWTGYKSSSDWFIDSNIQLAIAASRMVRHPPSLIYLMHSWQCIQSCQMPSLLLIAPLTVASRKHMTFTLFVLRLAVGERDRQTNPHSCTRRGRVQPIL